MVGPPGAGKSLMAACLPGILPELSPGEALEVSMVASVAGLLPEGGLIRARPFRAPHHSASMAALIGGGQTKFTPLFVGDLAEAIARLIDKGEASSLTYELGGPEVFSFKQLMEFTLETIGRKRLLVPVPWPIAKVMGTVMGLLPFAPLTADQVELLKTDNVVSEAAAREGRDLTGLGITGRSIQGIVPSYLYRYRRAGQFTVPKGIPE